MSGINVTSTEALVELVLLVLFPVVLWGLYKFELHREKKHSQRQMLKK